MQLRSRRMLFNVKHLGYLLVRFLLKDIKVENSTASIRKFGHKRHQQFFGNTASSPDSSIYPVCRELLLIHHQLAETFLFPQVV